MNLYVYFVVWYDEQELFARGVTIGDSYNDAMRRVVEYYGQDNIIRVALENFGENCVEDADINLTFENFFQEFSNARPVD